MNTDLRKLGRRELLEMLIEQSEEVLALQKQLDEANAALAEKNIAIDKAGSIAEAALALNGVFDATERACRQYAENARRQSDQLLAEARRMADSIIAEASRRSKEMLHPPHEVAFMGEFPEFEAAEG